MKVIMMMSFSDFAVQIYQVSESYATKKGAFASIIPLRRNSRGPNHKKQHR